MFIFLKLLYMYLIVKILVAIVGVQFLLFTESNVGNPSL